VSCIETLKVYKYEWLSIVCLKVVSVVSKTKYCIDGLLFNQKNELVRLSNSFELTVCIKSITYRLSTFKDVEYGLRKR
jgi:hypothetical protein